MEDKVKPYIILKTGGGLLTVLQTNQKGYKKSIENNQIWAVNPETERLLPEDLGGRPTGFRERDGWYEADYSIAVSEDAADTASAIEAGPVAEDDYSFLARLFALISKRKQELPEGSYTTHLFTSGEEKIRKKTGEEAVELLLARSREDIIYESADLVYHMMVFLAEKGIGFDEIVSELQSRE